MSHNYDIRKKGKNINSSFQGKLDNCGDKIDKRSSLSIQRNPFRESIKIKENARPDQNKLFDRTRRKRKVFAST